MRHSRLVTMSAIQSSLPSSSPHRLPRGDPLGLRPHPHQTDPSLCSVCFLSPPLPFASPLFLSYLSPPSPRLPSSPQPHSDLPTTIPYGPAFSPGIPDDPKPLSSPLLSPSLPYPIPPLTSLWSRGYLRHNWCQGPRPVCQAGCPQLVTCALGGRGCGDGEGEGSRA